MSTPTIEPDVLKQPVRKDQGSDARRNWQFQISGRQSAYAWLLAALLGALAISAAPRQGDIRLFTPVAIMVLYVLISYPRGSVTVGLIEARVTQLADSAYFLGFLWTLWALIDSFVLNRPSTADTADTAFRVFGYALITTAAGMTVRLYLLQFKYGADDQAAEADLSIERNLQVLLEAMKNASSSIDVFQQQVNLVSREIAKLSKTLESAEHGFAETHGETMNAIRKNIGGTVDEIRGALKAPVQEYGRSIRAFTANVDQQSSFLVQTIQKTTAAVGEAVEDGAAKATRVINDAGQSISSDHSTISKKLADEVAELVHKVHEMSVRLTATDAPVTQLKKIEDTFNGLADAADELKVSMSGGGGIKTALDAFATETEKRTQATGDALESLTSRLRSVIVPPQVEIDLSGLTRSADSFQRATKDLLQVIGDPRWNTAPDTALSSILQLSKSLDKLRQSLDAVRSSAVEGPSKKRWWSWSR
jgi:hypothetical protein